MNLIKQLIFAKKYWQLDTFGIQLVEHKNKIENELSMFGHNVNGNIVLPISNAEINNYKLIVYPRLKRYFDEYHAAILNYKYNKKTQKIISQYKHELSKPNLSEDDRFEMMNDLDAVEQTFQNNKKAYKDLFITFNHISLHFFAFPVFS